MVKALIWFYATGLFITFFIWLWSLLCYIDDP